MSRKLDNEVIDWCKWFHEHKGNVGRSQDLVKVEAFYSKAIDGLLSLVALTALDLRALEERKSKSEERFIITPKLRANG